MTPLEKFIAESQAVCDAASPAPWEHTNINSVHGPKSLVCSAYDAETEEEESRQEGDFAFIAHARTALPTALQHLRELSRENAALRERIADMQDEARNPPTLRTVCEKEPKL